MQNKNIQTNISHPLQRLLAFHKFTPPLEKDVGWDLFSRTPTSGHIKLGNSRSRNSSFRFREVGIAFFFN